MDYNKLLEKAKIAYNNAVTGGEKRRLESIFPELKESEDDRNKKIKREVTEMLNYYHSKSPCFIPPQFSLEETLAWLEKQGENHIVKDNEMVQQKQEWSKEDYNMIDCCTSAIWAADYYSREDKEKMEEWLKSLKPQSHWKPTEEQMNLLHWIKENKVFDKKDRETLCSLYDDLKKL